jgi:hypothetical protein
MKIIMLLLCLAAVGLAPNLAAQQITGIMRGTVTDSSGPMVEGASVTAIRLPDSEISSPTFNQIQAALRPRVVQLALKFLF